MCAQSCAFGASCAGHDKHQSPGFVCGQSPARPSFEAHYFGPRASLSKSSQMLSLHTVGVRKWYPAEGVRIDEDGPRISRFGIFKLAPERVLPDGIEPAERLAVMATIEDVDELAVLPQLVTACAQPVGAEITVSGRAAELQGEVQAFAGQTIIERIVLRAVGRAFGEISE